jgi:GNAT superfamily N-acetyltransferase
VADAEAIAAAHVASWRAGYAGLVPHSILAGLDVGERTRAWRGHIARVMVYVGERDGAMAGFASLALPARTLDEPGTGEITALYVHPDHWRHGVGRTLMLAVTEQLRAAGVEQAALWVLEGNTRGRAFYAALGFAPDGTRAIDERTGLPELLLRAPLAAPPR